MLNFFKKNQRLPENFCIAPFVQMDLNEQGHVNACCKAKDILGYWSKEKISTLWNDVPIKNLRAAFLQGTKPRGCKSCWEEEENGIVSRRQDYNIKYKSNVDELREQLSNSKIESLLHREVKFHALDIGFSAQCTLRCRMCGPSASSSWLSKALENKNVYKYFAELGELNPRILETQFKDFLSDELFEDFCSKVAPKVGDLMINGGEPLASRHNFLFFSTMKSSDLANLKVSLTTNAQSTSFKEQSLIPYWSLLKIFNYRVSIDNVGEKYSYIRSNASLQKLQNSVHQVREGFSQDPGKLKIIFTTAVSLYNITDLPSLIKFSIHLGAINHFNWVHFPHFLSAIQTPQKLALETASQLRDFLKYLPTIPDWQEHQLWQKDFRDDNEYESIIKLIFQDSSASTLNTYKDYALLRLQTQIQEIISLLEAKCLNPALPQEFKEHVALMDQVFDTRFEKLYEEFSPYF